MNSLVMKELKLSIHKFMFVLPVLLGLLMFIPMWIYILVFMYFFWISVAQIYGSYIAQNDTSFCAMLPVTKEAVVKSKIIAFLLLEGLHLAMGIIFGIIHNAIYGSYNVFFDINIAFFGVVILMYALFNLVFLPMHFKTGYYYGKATIYGVVVTLVYGFIMEYGVTKFQVFRDVFEGDFLIQMIVLIVSLMLSTILTIITLKTSIKNYERIDSWNL